MTDTSYRFYLAGDLFSYKALVGNQLLADAIERVSDGKFQAILPQSLEMPSNRAKDIRNEDYAALIQCDLILAQFDGTELDSGTVAEFMLAKQLDIPALLFRSDFRHSGDQEEGGDSWNLMLSHFPRTEGLAVNAMEELHQAGSVTNFISVLAEALVERLERLIQTQPLIEQNQAQAVLYYQQTLQRLGMSDHFDPVQIETLVSAKKSKGIL